MVVINSAGWYLISSDENESIDETIDNLKQNTNDSYTLYNRIYYYEDPWPKNNNFLDITWKSLDISDYISGNIGKIYMDPNLGFWVLLTSYTVAPPEPEAEPGSEPIAETGALDISSWLQIGSDIDGVSSSDNLGWSVAMNSDATRIVTGAPESATGHVRVYDWDGSNWTQIGYIVGEAYDDQSGYSVAMSSDGTRIAIGASDNNGNDNTDSDRGHVRVYDYKIPTTDEWTNGNVIKEGDTDQESGKSYFTQVGGDIDGEDIYNGYLGLSVALSSDGTRIAIGTIENDGVNGTNSGHVRVYNRDTNEAIGWKQVGGDIDGEIYNNQSGWSVAMNGDGTRIAIGAPYNDSIYSNPSYNSGHVRVYEYDATKIQAVTNQNSSTFGPIGWNRVGGDIDGEVGGESGYSVAMNSSGTRIAIGAPYNDGVNGGDSGHVRVYEYDATKTTAVTDQTSSTFGPIGWNRVYVDIDGELNGDQSGYSVAMNSSGTRIAIGAPYNDGVNGGDSGHVRVYEYDATKTTAVTDQTSSTFGPIGWNRLIGDIYGEANYDYSGRSVAMSSDGTRIAIGAIFNNGNGDDSGHVRVYKFYDPLAEPEPEPEAEPESEPESEPEPEAEPE